MAKNDYRIIKGGGADYVSDCERILRALPAWFGIEEAIDEYVEQIARLPTWVASLDDEVVGFISVEMHTEKAAEIIVMGVLQDHHRQGIGAALVKAVEEELGRRGIEFLQVKTLSPGRESKAYEKTRHFYEAVGFAAVQEFPTLWGEANPCLQLMKSLSPGNDLNTKGGDMSVPTEVLVIAEVDGPQKEPVDDRWGDVESSIILIPDWHGALNGIEEFSHAVVVFWMHEAPLPSGSCRRPRGRDDMPEVGLLAQRSRHRPNPLGVTAVEIVEARRDRLVVRGLDAIAGTPVLDIKPYVPAFDAREATVPEWMVRLMDGYF